MTILAVCGPIGSDFKAFSEQCHSLLNTENTLLIDSSTYKSIDLLLSAIKSAPGDIIIFGADIFLDGKLRSNFDIKVFLELDSDLCLSNYLKSFDKNECNLEEQLNYYLTQIKPLNEQVRLSAKYAALRRPQASPNDKLIELLINEDDKTINKHQILSASSKDMFWKPESQSKQRASSENTVSFEFSPLSN
ncbi:uridine kinase [Legionella qingyii]|uniref:Uridine kinase n=2 Tax=Legionella qingyii TaxID=2184757 RepID=A0A317TYH1_9GAMM|nr:uridine kinase [Legionella qingyii]PWY54088.1 uridine kinase [Legionella qingyii]RUR19344.1 uridine kinase [Legionella qingyii]RUR21726.1 uridine kinase [Legionella qingyii]